MGILDINIFAEMFLILLKISVCSIGGILLVMIFSPLLEKRHTVFWRYLLWILFAVRLVLPYDFSVPGYATPVSLPMLRSVKGQEISLITPVGSVTGFLKIKNQGKIMEESELEQLQGGQREASSWQVPDRERDLSLYTKDRITEDLPESGSLNLRNDHLGSDRTLLPWAAVIWAMGAVMFFAWQIGCYVLFCRKRDKTKVFLGNKENLPVYQSALVASPVLMGIYKPQILLPEKDFEEEQLEFILNHEFMHYKRKDLWVKLLFAGARTIHWFNPFVYGMERQAARDIELLCDSQTVRNYTKEQKKQYGEALLFCAASKTRSSHILCTSEFSRDAKTLKKRFSNIFSDGRKKKGILAAVVGIAVVLSVSLFVTFGVTRQEYQGMSIQSASFANRKGVTIAFENIATSKGAVYAKFLENCENEKVQEKVDFDLRWSDLGKIDEKEFLYQDEEGWTYYLEEDRDKKSPIWEFADVLNPFLLTRYRDDQRQILEDLIYQDLWEECPVLFVDGRILYKAAPTADIIGVKTPMLVSIAMDGSDRKTADTIMYHQFDGLCEDNGWIYYTGWVNDNTSPKPLCRIRPDLSGGPQFVEDLPGLLCGVKDGYVYYMSSGIWKRNLDGGEEQIYDKWGVSAEELDYFNVRERVFAAGELRDHEVQGCHIIFSHDSGEGLYESDVAFE